MAVVHMPLKIDWYDLDWPKLVWLGMALLVIATIVAALIGVGVQSDQTAAPMEEFVP